MTRSEEIAYWKSKTREQLVYERFALKEVLKYFKTSYAKLINLIDNFGVEEAIQRLSELDDNDGLLFIYSTIYSKVGRDAFISFYKDIKSNLGGSGADTFASALFLQKIADLIKGVEVIKRIESIRKTTHDRIIRLFNEGKKQNLTVSKLKRFIRKNFLGDYAKNRSKLIALTETSFVSGMAEEEAAIYVSRELNVVLEKKWIRYYDERLRNSHHNVTTKYIPIESTFNVGGYNARMPYDKILPLKETMNCRCRLHYRKVGGGVI